MDVATDQLDKLIERRARSNPDPDELEPSYAESIRRFHAHRRARIRWEWVRYFDRMAESHRKLSEDYERRAEALCEEGAT